ncbi:type III-B CRISPR module-associated protein Cmr5 [Myxococcota bacterium]|jgi:CRISPR-associated protein Cmr5|nr:type III-B CRISPR module-associated protein Cmr5 [Myxococcota bacterium]
MSERVAKTAFAGVQSFTKDFGLTDADKKLQGRYLTLARKLPAMLQVNGLGQTVAFLYSKGSGTQYVGAEGRILRLLDELTRLDDRTPGPADPLQRIVNMTPTAYRVATQKAMVGALWIKRVAEGMIDVDGVDE